MGRLFSRLINYMMDTKTLETKTPNRRGSRIEPPKLTVAQLVKKFVRPSSHRKFVQLEESGTKANKK